MALDKLKPCPFCGGEARLFVSDGVRVLCTKCRASSKILVDSECYKTSAVEKVIEAWNRRTNDDIQEKRQIIRQH
nr:MAG TPA: restriction alleviation protein [Caudoviricetes sp.]